MRVYKRILQQLILACNDAFQGKRANNNSDEHKSDSKYDDLGSFRAILAHLKIDYSQEIKSENLLAITIEVLFKKPLDFSVFDDIKKVSIAES